MGLLAIFVATVAGIIARPFRWAAIAIVGIAVAVGTRTLTLTEALSGLSKGTAGWWHGVLIAAAFIKTGLGARIASTAWSQRLEAARSAWVTLVAADLVLAPAIPSNTHAPAA